MAKEFFEALDALSQENGITSDELLAKIKQGIEKAVRKEMPGCQAVRVDSTKDGKIQVKVLKTVVAEVTDPDNEITLEDARLISKRATLGGTVEIKINPTKFGRVAAQGAKQFIKQDLKEYERQKLIEIFESKKEDCASATVVKVEPVTYNAILTIEGKEVYLVRKEQIPGETLVPGDIIKVYISDVANKEKKPIIRISRSRKDLVRRLFELEVPEMFDGIVEVKGISREAGSRSKIAVYSKDPNVDAIGACIGPKRSRIQSIVDELKGEKIDIIEWSEDEAEFVKKALAPAEVISVEITEDGSTIIEDDKHAQKACRVVVPNDQLSLAIGNKGQNAKLAAKLTGFKIDIVPLNPVN